MLRLCHQIVEPPLSDAFSLGCLLAIRELPRVFFDQVEVIDSNYSAFRRHAEFIHIGFIFNTNVDV